MSVSGVGHVIDGQKVVIHDEEVKNREALANPDALDLYAGLDALNE